MYLNLFVIRIEDFRLLYNLFLAPEALIKRDLTTEVEKNVRGSLELKDLVRKFLQININNTVALTPLDVETKSLVSQPNLFNFVLFCS